MEDQKWRSIQEYQGVQILWPFKRMIFLLVIVSLLSGGLGAGMVYYGLSSQVTAAPAETYQPTLVSAVSASKLEALDQMFLLDSEKNTIAVVEATLSGVVQINTKSSYTTASDYDYYSWFFGQRGNTPRTVTGNGSGFIYDLEGHIVTNFHVVEGADTIEVILYNLKPYKATVVGADKKSDLAVLKIEAPANELNPLPLANSDLIQVGQKAIAIGSPLASSNDNMGLSNSPSVTQGIVSAKDRTMPVTDESGVEIYTIEGLVQTDAAINPGNSGGPLLNSSGEVIGVNTAIISSAQGMGFAIPSSLVQKNVSDLIAGRSVVRPRMGITYQSLEKLKSILGEQYNKLNLPLEQGALLISVEKGSAAEKAGLRGSSKTVTIEVAGKADEVEVGGDIITAINGTVVTGNNLSTLVRRYNAGDTITITYLRDGVEMEATLVLDASIDE